MARQRTPLSANENTVVLNACYAYHFLNDAITFVLPTVMVLLFKDFRLNWLESGVIFAMNLLAMILFQLVMGYYSDIVDQKNIMLAGMALLGVSTLLMAMSFDFSSLLIYAILLGLGLGIQHASSYSISARIMTEKVNRQAAFGDFGKGTAIVCSTLLLFFLPGDVAWRGSFVAWGIATLCAAAFVAFKLRSFHLVPSGYSTGTFQFNETVVEDRMGRKAVLRRIAALAGLFVLFMLYSAQFQVISNNLTTYMGEYKGFDTRVAPFFFVVFFIFATAGSFSSLPLSRRFDKKDLLMANYLVYLITLVLYVAIDPRDATTNAIFCAALAFFSYTTYPIILQTLSARSPRAYLGLVFGITMGLGWVGGFVSSLMAGFLSDMFTAQAIFFIAIVVVACSLVVLWRTRFA
ncbi:MAG: MFS transporter [Candidatus Sigynarchaeota archaeon]